MAFIAIIAIIAMKAIKAIKLSLNPAVGASSCKGFNFGLADEVVISVDGLLQSRCGDGKFKRLALGRHCQKSVDKAAGEGVSAAYAVDDGVDVIAFRLIEFIAVIDHRLPAIVGCGE